MNATIVRPLGAIETRMALMHREMQGTNQGCQICVLQGNVASDSILAAAKQLFDTYQALRCAIAQHEGELVFVEHAQWAQWAQSGVQERSFDISAEAEATAMRQQVFEEELNRPLDCASALWRILILREVAAGRVSLVVTCHHAIVDGLASFALIEDLLGKIDQLGSAVLNIPITAPVDAPLAPAIDSFLLPPRATPAVAMLDGVPFQQAAPLQLRRTRNHYVVLSRAEHEQLKQHASAEQLTLNSMLGAALAAAALELGMAQEPVALKSAVSLRHVAPASARLGCYIAVADAQLALGQAPTAVAKSYETQLFVRIGRECMRRSTASAEAVLEVIAQASKMQSFSSGIGLTFPGTIALANTYQHFQVIAYDAAANRVGGNLAVVATVISFQEQLTLGLAFVEPLIDRATVAAFGDAVRARLLNCTNSSIAA